MELVKNKPHDPQQLLSASSTGMLGAAAAAPRDKSISPLPAPQATAGPPPGHPSRVFRFHCSRNPRLFSQPCPG